MNNSDIVYGILFQPVNTLRRLADEQPVARGLLAFFLVSIVSLFFKQAIFTLILPSALKALIGRTSWLYSGLGFCLSLVMLLVMTGVLSLLSALLYKKSNPLALLTCLSFSALPGILGPPLFYAAVLLGHGNTGWFISFLAGIWVLVLQVISLREAMELDTGQAVLLYTLPVLAVFLLGALAVLGLVMTFPMSSLN